jgi:hypothetical protein
VEYERRLQRLANENSSKKKRELALSELAPMLVEHQTAFLEIGRSLRVVDDDWALVCRSDLIYGEMMDEVSAAAEWSRRESDFDIRMIEAMPGYSDEEA